MIVLDPVGNHLGGVDTDKEGLVRFAIGGLNKLADDLDCMILGVRHLAKIADPRRARSRARLDRLGRRPSRRARVRARRRGRDGLPRPGRRRQPHRPHRRAGYRIELRDVGLKEPVTCAVALGESTKSVDELLAAPRRESKSADARELILDILETDGEQESDALDARVADETGLAAKTVRNLRGELKNAGLIKAVPESDEPFGAVDRWKVARTTAPRPGGGGARVTRRVPEVPGSGTSARARGGIKIGLFVYQAISSRAPVALCPPW